jgi:hypothetical protein
MMEIIGEPIFIFALSSAKTSLIIPLAMANL